MMALKATLSAKLCTHVVEVIVLHVLPVSLYPRRPLAASYIYVWA